MAEASAGYSLTSYFGGKDTQGYQDYKAGQKAGKWADLPSYIAAGGSNSGGANSTVQKALDLQKQAVAPAVASLEAGIPEIANKYTQQRTQLQAEQQPLQQRYDSLIQSIKGNQQTAENRQTVTTSNELGRRGILGSSGLAQQEITNAVNPITQQYTGMIQQTGLEGNQALRELANQIANTYTGETESTRAIRNAIAQLQSGAAQTGVAQGYQQQAQQIAQQQAQQQLAAQQAQAQREADWQKMLYQTIQLPQSQAELANINSLIADRNSTSGNNSSLTNFLNSLQSSNNSNVDLSKYKSFKLG